MRQWLLAVLIVLPGLPGLAQTVEVPAGVPPSDAAGQALVEAFQAFCLGAFPDRPVEGAGPLEAMRPEQVREFLHEDPGHGWFVHAADGTYVLTVEDPPFHTCAVRREYRAPPQYKLAYYLATGLWAASQGRGGFVTGAPQRLRRGRLSIVAQERTLPGPRGDIFLEIETTYPDGHVEQRLARRAMGR